MSSNRPPQLHLELPPNTTSFKRSFEEFGFDFDSPLGGPEAGASGSDGNDRNKRARSATSFSDDEESVDSSSSSTMSSTSTSMSIMADNRAQSALSATRPAAALGTPHFSLSVARASLEPPRLPTPDLQDIDMADYTLVRTHQPEEQAPSNSATAAIAPGTSQTDDDSYRLSLERFNAFDSQIAALRRSPSPRTQSRTPPPVLPPLTLLDDQPPLTTNTIPFLHPPAQFSPPPLSGASYNFGSRLRRTPEGRQEDPRTTLHELRTRSESSTSPRGKVQHF